MSQQPRGILKTATLPDWEEADEIIHNVWLGTLTDNKQAVHRGITDVICISKDPHGDLQREGFRNAPDLDSNIYTIDSDEAGNLLPLFAEVCDAIEGMLQEGGQGLLVWDAGAGVAMMAAYLMRRYGASLPEALTVITRARLKKPKRTLLPRQRIVDLLHNENYQRQLDMWQACDFDHFEHVIRNPHEPREKWIVEAVGEEVKKKRRREALLPFSKRDSEELARLLSGEQMPLHQQQHQQHQQQHEQQYQYQRPLSTIDEVEEEVNRLSAIFYGEPF